MSYAEEQIGFVIRILRIIGWLFSILFVPLAILMGALLIYNLIAGKQESLDTTTVVIVILVMVAAGLSVAHIIVAGQLKRRKPFAGKMAIVLFVVSLFSCNIVFQLVAVVCLIKICQHYEDYCLGDKRIF